MIRATRDLLFALVLFAIPFRFAVSIAPRSQLQPSEETIEVILALQRSQALHVLDAATLETLGSFVAGNMDRSVGASPDGRTLFIEQASSAGGCCALFALDLETRKICRLGPSNTWATTADGRFVFVQYGNSGIEVFDARTLARMPRMAVYGGPYTFYPSPDTRWLFGISYFRGPKLDVFDIDRRELIGRLALEDGKFPRGVWLEDKFYCFAHDGKQGLLWQVTPETNGFGPPVTVALPDLANKGDPVWMEVIALGQRLIVYEVFGMKLDRRRSGNTADSLPGGLFVIDPTDGRVVSHFAPSLRFSRLVVSADGEQLYGLDSGALDWQGPVRLLKINAGTGEVSATRVLETNVWSIKVTNIPRALVPRGEVRVESCENESQQP